MKMVTKYFGEQEVKEDEALAFPYGLPGFQKEKRFILQPLGETFSVLQSLDHAQVAFIVTSPFLFFESYSVDLPEHFVKQLDIHSESDVSVFAIVSVRKPFIESTINLKAPIIINTRKRVGKQYIPDRSPYGLRHRFIPKEKDVG
ncbi:flagellar assembly protein FliW [Sporolactobacillus sp. THM7-7]|nr:flagellar assembly protein FliW [Sporolactobacillus sp. THM7-7]